MRSLDKWQFCQRSLDTGLHQNHVDDIYWKAALLDKVDSTSVPSLTYWWWLEANCEVELKFLTVSSPTSTYLSAPLLALSPPVPLLNSVQLLTFNSCQNHKSTFYLVTFPLDRGDKNSCLNVEARRKKQKQCCYDWKLSSCPKVRVPVATQPSSVPWSQNLIQQAGWLETPK